ncbi:MAG: ABC transporter ATP-binding protein, partial [Bradyrhizobium sp.]|nr:ABC transporter ATP-binding protein [Bradyrhizobium sp.]
EKIKAAAGVGDNRDQQLIPDPLPTAALGVSVQAVVLNLLQDLKQQLGMSYLFVSHDLNVVRLLCDRVIVMRSGRIVEEGSSERVLGDPQHDYTRELLTAIPHPPLPVH